VSLNGKYGVRKIQFFLFPGPQKRTSGKISFCFHIFNSKNTYKNDLPKLRIEGTSFFLLSETNFGNKFWKQILEAKLGNKFQKKIWKQILGTKLGNKFWKKNLETNSIIEILLFHVV
jgi:hypothetical protein